MALNWKLTLLLASVFSAGFFVQSEIVRRRDLRRELDEIRNEQIKVMQQVDSINDAYAAQKLTLIQKTDSLYQQIDEIIQLKTLNAQYIRSIQENINRQRQQIMLDIHDLKETIGQHPVGLQQEN